MWTWLVLTLCATCWLMNVHIKSSNKNLTDSVPTFIPGLVPGLGMRTANRWRTGTLIEASALSEYVHRCDYGSRNSSSLGSKECPTTVSSSLIQAKSALHRTESMLHPGMQLDGVVLYCLHNRPAAKCLPNLHTYMYSTHTPDTKSIRNRHEIQRKLRKTETTQEVD